MMEPDMQQVRIQYGAERMWYASRMTKATMQTRIRSIQYLLFFHDNNGYLKAPQCYVVRILPALFV